MPEHVYRALVLSVVKHDYLPNAVASHPRFQLVAVADDPDRMDWLRMAHARGRYLGMETELISERRRASCYSSW